MRFFPQSVIIVLFLILSCFSPKVSADGSSDHCHVTEEYKRYYDDYVGCLQTTASSVSIDPPDIFRVSDSISKIEGLVFGTCADQLRQWLNFREANAIRTYQKDLKRC